jgi:glycosyltransferase involved in cell wall biosynthesis
MNAVPTTSSRVRLAGKFFRLGDRKFYVKGVCYGPFAVRADDGPFASQEQTLRDFKLIRQLGANLLRVYAVPPRWFLDLAEAHQLKLLIDIPWDNRRCFLDSAADRAQARQAVRQGVAKCAGHPAVFAFSVANEVPPEIVRWSGARAVAAFIDELVAVAKDIAPECLCTFGNYPPTEFLCPRQIDFLCFNVYLDHTPALESYLARLQMLAHTRPLILGEFGFDSDRVGESSKSQRLSGQIAAAFGAGLAGAVVYSFTDEWFKDGKPVSDWAMGLTTRDRQPKPSFYAVQEAFGTAPYFPLPRWPKVSVVVAVYNGGRTLRACLESLVRLTYPDYEVIVVDDGSTDATGQIASLFPTVRYLRQPHRGLSVARNTGIAAAQGEIVAFTDADCQADEDWLYYLVAELLRGNWAGAGGHNLLPAEDLPGAAAVLAAPGGPAHVMLTDREAEHLPGCNMAFWKWALDQIGGFDPLFTTAGDDVDVCWRLLEHGQRLGFSPGGFVWHHRRPNARSYLRQQAGYGRAEALLMRKHPEYFNALGGTRWRGRIYSRAACSTWPGRSVIYHGIFATGFFQALYAADPIHPLLWCTSLEYHGLVTVPLLILSAPFPVLLPVGLAALALSVGVCVAAALRADVPKPQRRWWSRPLVASLFWLQPIVRGWARWQGRLMWETIPKPLRQRLTARRRLGGLDVPRELYYWADGRLDRVGFLAKLTQRLDAEGWPNRTDAGWSDHDLEIHGNRWSRVRLTTVNEDYSADQRLFRFRLRSAWSLAGWVAMGSVVAAGLLGAGLWGRTMPWSWLVPLAVAVGLGSFLEIQRRMLRQWVGAFVDELAREQGWTRLRLDPASQSFVPA